jgi:type I restriction enzyme S subunit
VRDNARLDDLCWIQSGGTPRRGQSGFFGGSVPWAKISDLDAVDGVVRVTEEQVTEAGLAAIGNRLVPPGTVLLAMYGSVGKTAVAGVPLSMNQAILGIQVRDQRRLDGGYLQHWLKSIQPQLIQSANGVTQQNISATAVRALRISLPPLAQQRRIAALLDRADAVRRKREESRRLVDELLRSVFLEMFGDPVRNEKGWEVVPAREVVADIRYGTAKKANTDGRGLPILRMNNITYSGDLDLSDLKSVELAERERTQCTVARGDLLFNRTNSPELVGKIAIWDRDEEYAFAGYLVRVRLKNQFALPEYVSAALNSQSGKALLRSTAKPSNNMSNISASAFGGLWIPLPPLTLQQQFQNLDQKLKACLARRIERAEGLSERLNSVLRQDSLASRSKAGSSE